MSSKGAPRLLLGAALWCAACASCRKADVAEKGSATPRAVPAPENVLRSYFAVRDAPVYSSPAEGGVRVGVVPGEKPVRARRVADHWLELERDVASGEAWFARESDFATQRAKSSPAARQVAIARRMPSVVAPMVLCRDLFYEPASGRLFHEYGSVEREIDYRGFFEVREFLTVTHQDMCPAAVVYRSEGKSRKVAPGGDSSRHEPTELASPTHSGSPGAGDPAYVGFAPPAPSQIASAFRPGASLFWLSSDTERCVELGVERASPRSPARASLADASLSGELVERGSSGKPVRRYRFFVLQGANETPAQLLLGQPTALDRTPLLKCNCERLFRILKVEGETLTLHGGVFKGDSGRTFGGENEFSRQPLELEAYDPAWTERWFGAAGACADALERNRRALADDPRSTPRLGLHASELDHLDLDD